MATASINESSFAAFHSDLNPYVDLKRATCENGHRAVNVLILHKRFPNDTVRSVRGPSMLMYVPFTQAVNLVTLYVRAPESGQRPSGISLFKNVKNVTLNGVGYVQPTQTYALTDADWTHGIATLQLKPGTFKNVQSVTVFVSDNDGREDVTALTNLMFLGSTVGPSTLKKKCTT